MSAEKTPGISAIDTTNFARQIVLDFEFAPVPKQRQRRGLRNEIIEVGAVKLDYHGNVMGEFSQFVQAEFTEGVAFPVRELTGISAVDTAMADPLYVVIKRLGDWIGRYSAQIVCWSGTDRRQLLTECQAKRIDLSAFPTDWADLQAFYTSIMDVGSHGRVSLGDAATWFGIEFDESTGHAHSALADARVTAKLLKQMMEGDYHVSPHAQEIRQRWGMGERPQTRLSSKCPELGDLLLKLKAEGRQGAPSAHAGAAPYCLAVPDVGRWLPQWPITINCASSSKQKCRRNGSRRLRPLPLMCGKMQTCLPL